MNKTADITGDHGLPLIPYPNCPKFHICIAFHISVAGKRKDVKFGVQFDHSTFVNQHVLLLTYKFL